jgi:hypothetical protein
MLLLFVYNDQSMSEDTSGVNQWDETLTPMTKSSRTFSLADRTAIGCVAAGAMLLSCVIHVLLSRPLASRLLWSSRCELPRPPTTNQLPGSGDPILFPSQNLLRNLSHDLIQRRLPLVKSTPSITIVCSIHDCWSCQVHWTEQQSRLLI